MLLRLTCSRSDWTGFAALLKAVDSPILAGVVRELVAAAPERGAAEAVALNFTPEQAGKLQQVAAALGLSLPARPVFAEPDPAGWTAATAERAEAVAAAAAIVRAHQRQRAVSSALRRG